MKKSIFYLNFGIMTISCLFSFNINSQTAQWLRQAGTGGQGFAVSSEVSGNCYVTGLINDPALFDSLSSPAHFADMFIAKYDINSNLQWAHFGGDNLIDKGFDIATDASGNSYVTGSYQTNNLYPTVKFDSITLTGTGSFDFFLSKYDSFGNLIWIKNGGSKNGDAGSGVALINNNLYVCGYFSDTAYFSTDTIISNGLYDMFVAKYDTSGNFIWIKRAGGPGDDIANKLVIDINGNLALTGRFQNTASFDANTVTSSGLQDIFVAKYDSSGNNLWVKRAGGSLTFSGDEGNDIASDLSGNLFVTGQFAGSANFDSFNLIPNGSSSKPDIFVAKYDVNGNVLWVHHGGGSNADNAYTIITDYFGNSIVSGFADSGPGVIFDSISLPPIGNEYIFLAKYDSNGNIQFVKQYAPGSGQGLAFTRNNCIYLTGGTSAIAGNPAFDTIALQYVDRAAFTVLICDQGTPLAIQNNNRPIENIFVYPNPASNELNILSSDLNNYSLELFNYLGQNVFSKNINCKSETISTSNLKGIYFLKITFPSNEYIIKRIEILN